MKLLYIESIDAKPVTAVGESTISVNGVDLFCPKLNDTVQPKVGDVFLTGPGHYVTSSLEEAKSTYEEDIGGYVKTDLAAIIAEIHGDPMEILEEIEGFELLQSEWEYHDDYDATGIAYHRHPSGVILRVSIDRSGLSGSGYTWGEREITQVVARPIISWVFEVPDGSEQA